MRVIEVWRSQYRERESVCLHRTHPAHLVLGCRRIWLSEHLRSHGTGNAVRPVLAPGAAPWENNVVSLVVWNGSAGNYKQWLSVRLPVRQLNYKVAYGKNRSCQLGPANFEIRKVTHYPRSFTRPSCSQSSRPSTVLSRMRSHFNILEMAIISYVFIAPSVSMFFFIYLWY